MPSGSVAVFGSYHGERLLEHESGLRDIAVDEEVEIDMGESADVQVSVTREKTRVDSAHAKLLPLVPGVTLRAVKVDDVERVDVSNARAAGIDFELRLRLPEGERIVRADHPLGDQERQTHFPIQGSRQSNGRGALSNPRHRRWNSAHSIAFDGLPSSLQSPHAGKFQATQPGPQW